MVIFHSMFFKPGFIQCMIDSTTFGTDLHNKISIHYNQLIVSP